MKSYPADEFFDGRQLELARAIDRNDMNALRANAAGVDLSAAGRKEMTLLWYGACQDSCRLGHAANG